MQFQQSAKDSSDDLSLQRASLLVTGAQSAAVSLFIPVLEKHPRLKEVTPADWDFFVTVAFVFVALTQLNHEGLSEARLNRLLDTVSGDFQRWQKDAGQAFEDCKAFYDRTFDGLENNPEYAGDKQRFLSAHIIGTWICWNLFKHAPEDLEERELASRLGIIAASEFTRWWRP